MKKRTLRSIILLIASIVFAQASGAQVPTADQQNVPGLQNESFKCVRIAVIDSQKAFDRSAEGKKLLGKIESLSKKTKEGEILRIRDEMVELVKELAREKGYSLILDLKTSGIICYLAPVDDLTDELIKRYDSMIR